MSCALPGQPDRNSAVRILIVRLSAIGDVLMTSSVAEALREAYPNAHLTWLVEPASASFVRANPFVDDVLVFEHKKTWQRMLSEGKLISLVRAVRAYGQELRAQHFDIAIDFQGLFKSGLLTKLSGAPRRIGYRTADEGNRFFMTELVERPPHTTRITQANVAMLTALDIPVTPRRPVLAVPEDERAAAQEFLASKGLVGPYMACVIAPSRPQKEWVWSRWAEFAEVMLEREGLRTVFIGGPERRADTLRLVEGCKAQPISAVGHTSLLQSAAIVQDARLVVGCDTGLTYASLATDTPTVALYGSVDPTWLAEEPCVSVCFHPMPCSPCMRRPTCKNTDCMQAISVQEVVDTAEMLLQRSYVTA